MFKKKPRLPARPKAPTFEEITQDVENAPDDDIAFTYPLSVRPLASSVRSEMKHKDADDGFGDDSNTEDEYADPDLLFTKVKTFVEVNGSLQSSANNFREECEQLVESGQQLQAVAAYIKSQIATALQTSDATTSSLLKATYEEKRETRSTDS